MGCRDLLVGYGVVEVGVFEDLLFGVYLLLVEMRMNKLDWAIDRLLFLLWHSLGDVMAL